MAKLHRSVLHLAFVSYFMLDHLDINADEKTTRENTQRCNNKVWSQVSYSKSNKKKKHQIKIDLIDKCTYYL